MQSRKKTKAAAVAAAKMLLLAEGLAIGALIHGGVCLVGAHLNAVQAAIILTAAMVLAGGYGAVDAAIGFLHNEKAPFGWSTAQSG